MLFIGLTGGIGSGKSEALAACRRVGAAVLSTDEVVHDLLETDEVKAAARSAGAKPSSRTAISTAPRSRRSSSTSPDELGWLEQDAVPAGGQPDGRVASRARGRRNGRPPSPSSRCRCSSKRGSRARFDATVAVVADEELRAERAASRDHQAVDERAARQLTQDEKANRADHVLRNDGTLEDLDRAVEELLARIERESRARVKAI